MTYIIPVISLTLYIAFLLWNSSTTDCCLLQAFLNLAFCQQTDVSNIVPTELSQYIQLGTFSYWYKTTELTSYVYLWRENNGLKIFLLIISYWWFANDVIKNMIMKIMINLPKIFCSIFTTMQSVSVLDLKSFGQMKAELWTK